MTEKGVRRTARHESGGRRRRGATKRLGEGGTYDLSQLDAPELRASPDGSDGTVVAPPPAVESETSVERELAAIPEVPAIPEPAVREPAYLDKLDVLPWNTSEDLWSAYELLSLDLDDAGYRTTPTALIRAVLEEHLPDFSTETGRQLAMEYADTWKQHRKRGGGTRHAVNVRIKHRTKVALQDFQKSVLREQRVRVEVASIVSGILHRHTPTANQAMALLDKPSRRRSPLP